MQNKIYKLSRRSLDRLQGVDARLIAVVQCAIGLTKTDFGVIEGLRSLKTQKKYVACGKSQTMQSRHLDELAVDLMAYVGSRGCWELNLYDDIADAMRRAAITEGVSVRWGAAWNVPDIRNWDGTMEAAMNHYVDTRRTQGRRPFIDGPHFELGE